jgi:non-specific protein-tyrosine kinase
MSLVDLGRALRKRWRIVLAVTVLAELLAVAFLVSATPKYDATTQLFVASRDSSNPNSNAYEGGLFSAAQASSYVDIVNKQPILAPVVSRLHLPYTWQHLADEVSAANSSGTVIINITVRDPSAIRAQSIANAVSDEFASYVTHLETVGSKPARTGRAAPTTAQITASSPVKLTVVQHADLPTSPATPHTLLDVLAALLLGLAGGCALALLRDSMDLGVKDDDDVRAMLGAVALGSIPYDRRTPKHPVTLANKDGAARAEAFRRLRTNLQFVQLDEAPRSIVVTSSIPGEGKTTTACNVAVVLAQIGVSVILVEGDLRRPRVAEYLGIEGAVGLTSVLLGWSSMDDALQEWGSGDLQLRVLASGPLPPNPSELLAGDRMRETLLELEDLADVVIIDGPPLLPVADSAVLAANASGAVVVVRQGKTRRQQVQRAFEALRAVDATIYGVTLNMVKRQPGESSYGYAKYAASHDRVMTESAATPPAAGKFGLRRRRDGSPAG